MSITPQTGRKPVLTVVSTDEYRVKVEGPIESIPLDAWLRGCDLALELFRNHKVEECRISDEYRDGGQRNPLFECLQYLRATGDDRSTLLAFTSLLSDYLISAEDGGCIWTIDGLVARSRQTGPALQAVGFEVKP